MSVTPDPTVVEIVNRGWDPRVRMFRVPNEIDTAVIVTDRYVVFVDTMSSPEQAAAVVESVEPLLADRAPLVINTHADWDHAWGNALFETPASALPAPIIASRETGKRLRSREEHDYLAKRQQQEPALANVRLVPPTIEIPSGCTIDGGDMTIELIPTPGHVGDHVSVWIPEIRLLLAGDAAEHPFPYCGEQSNIDVFLQSLRRLRELRPAIVIPCHGGQSNEGLLIRNMQYFNRLDATIRSAQLQRGLEPGWYDKEGDLGEFIGFPFELAVREQGSDPASITDFYRSSHNKAIRAVAARVAAGEPPLTM
ncbi:MAG: putative beta-lactamase-like domain protein [Chloroflexi bacterium]|nr:putative beta-lactamase-like domain protein [Chloroflexota bacterium]